MSQYQEDGEWHPVAFNSETMAPAELNYQIHDKELLAVVRVLEVWRPELKGSERVSVYHLHRSPSSGILQHQEVAQWPSGQVVRVFVRIPVSDDLSGR